MQKQQANFKTFIVFLAVADCLAAGQRNDRLCVGALGLWADEQCAFRIAADPLLLCALCAGECVCRRVCRSSPRASCSSQIPLRSCVRF